MSGEIKMKKGEIWVSNFWDGQHAVVIGNRIEPNLWECQYLIKISDKKYAVDEGGRVSGNPLDDRHYTGDGEIIENAFIQFYHVEEGIEIIPMPEMSPEDSTTWIIYVEK